MIPQSKGKLFLADERGLNQLDWYRSYNTFNFGNYQLEHKAPFSNLYVLNDDTLAGGKSIRMCAEEHSTILLIPIVGAIEYMNYSGNVALIEPGQVQLLDMPLGGCFRVNNPHENDLINFLQLWIKTKDSVNEVFDFDLLQYKNSLIKVFEQESTIGYLGQFDGRAETVLPVKNPGNTFLAFVIDGAFEVQYRLMHPRDGLVLWDVNEVELEALSNNAVILLLEIGKAIASNQSVD